MPTSHASSRVFVRWTSWSVAARNSSQSSGLDLGRYLMLGEVTHERCADRERVGEDRGSAGLNASSSDSRRPNVTFFFRSRSAAGWSAG